MADTTTKKFLSLEGLQEYDALIKQDIVDAVSGKADSSHTHDDRYYTESEVDSKISAVNTSITNITSGSVVVKEAEHATSADSADSANAANSATKATQDASGNVITSTYETKTDASAKLTEAKTYADSAAAKVKSDLLNGAGTAYDTLKELGDLIDDNVDAIEALETVAAGKADAVHTHAIADVSGLQSALDGKAASSHGTHVTYSTTAPVMDGTASVGTATTVARSDHKHPTDTSRAAKTDLDTHASNTTVHITSTERTNWGTAYTHSQAAHAPSNAQANVIESIKVNGTAQTISSKSVNITVPTKASDIGAATADHTHTVDSSLSTTSTNPVQNKVVNSAISTLTSTVSANTSSINSHTTTIGNLQAALNEIKEITSSEIISLFAN